jgi:hypothetical protein
MSISRSASLLLLATVFACTESTSPSTGKAQITVTVTGLDVDPDGYQVMVDGSSAATIPGQGSVTLDLLIGRHSITLAGLASNCALQLPVVQPVTISQGETVPLNFAVVCGALTGVVKVTTVTTGLDPDPDGYQVTLGAGPVQILANGTTWFANVHGGAQSLTITGVAPNCTIAGSSPVAVNVSVGGIVRDTAAVTLNLSCTAATGVIAVTAATTGTDPDPDGYTFTIDGTPLHAVATNGTSPIAAIAGGTHSVALSGIADNCTVVGSNPVNATVTVGAAVRDTARVTFNVACTKIPPNGVAFVVTTTGSNLDDQYHVLVYSDSCDYYCDPSWEGNVPANGTVSLTLPVASYTYFVDDIAANCNTHDATGAFTVTNQHITTVGMAFACVPAGTLTIGVQASGVDIQPSYTAYTDGAYGYTVAAGGYVSLVLVAGPHSISLSHPDDNCTVAAPNPASVTVVANATVNVTFAVTCVAKPILRVTVATTGPNAPGLYLVGVDPDYYYGYQVSAPIPSNGTVSIKLQAGGHVVTLDQVPGNCTVTSPNNVSINLPAGTTTDLAFAVTCH